MKIIGNGKELGSNWSALPLFSHNMFDPILGVLRPDFLYLSKDGHQSCAVVQVGVFLPF